MAQKHLPWILDGFFLASTMGNETEHRVLDNMDDAKFKRWTLKVCLLIGGFYLCKGLQESLNL